MPKTSSDAAAAGQRTTLHGATMGTRWSASVDTGSAIDLSALQHDLAAAVQLVDEQMSPWKETSDLVRLNRAPLGVWVDLPPEMLEVLACALDVHCLSAGAFNPCVGALVDAWGFGPGRDVPDAQAIRHAREITPLAAHEALVLDRSAGRARKTAALQIDLCGIAKGYAVDRLARVLQQHGVRHALAALDGELRAVGGQAGGAPWAVGLEKPEVGRRTVHGVIEMEDVAVATSGDYRHFVDVGGKRLAHTMDPQRCAPVHNAVASVTVLASTCMQADAWATAFLVAGPDKGPALAQRLGMDVLFLLRQAQDLIEVGLGRFGNFTGSSGASMPR